MKGTVFEDRNMNASREMPKYECHKKVWALKIAGIVGDQHGEASELKRLLYAR